MSDWPVLLLPGQGIGTRGLRCYQENAVPAGTRKIIRHKERERRRELGRRKQKNRQVGKVLTNNQGLFNINYMLS